MKNIILLAIVAMCFGGWCTLFYFVGKQAGKYEAKMDEWLNKKSD